MRWYEYKMEVDDLHASEGLKAKLLAMQAKADASGATPKPQLTPVPVPEPAKKKKAIRFPGRRVLEVAACAALCGGILYGAARVGSLPSVTLFSGGSASSTAASSTAAAYEAAPELATYSMADAGGSADRADRAVNTSGSTLLTSGNVENDTAARTADNAKIIYTTYLSIETKDYDWAYQQLNDTLSSVDGYLESSNEYTDSTDSTRTLSLTLRVPESSYDAFVDAAEQTGSVTSKSESAEDVTTQYMDIEARLDSLTAQRTRLQELQASADNLTDLLQIESSLSDVQYQIESYQSQLNWYSQQVSYCTVNITLDEVETLTTGTSFAARLADAAKNGWSNFTAGAQAVVVFLMGAWPAIVIGAACGVVFYQVRHPRKKRPNPKDAK